MPTHHSRTDLGLRAPTRVTMHPNLPAQTVFIHHGASATPRSQPAEEEQWRQYQRYHMDVSGRGWSDIAYNKGAGPSGDTYEGRGWARQGGATGAPYDANSVSVCAIGNYHQDLPTDELVRAIARLIRNGIDRGRIAEDADIRPHRAVSQTACPGDHLVDALPRIRALVQHTAPEPPSVDGVQLAFANVQHHYVELGEAIDELGAAIGRQNHE